MSWLLVATCGDEPLRRSRWVAELTRSRLAPALTLTDEEAIRARFDEVISVHQPTGLAFFGHGRSDQLRDTNRSPIVDLDNLEHLRGMWVHAFACLSGQGLALLAGDAGLDLYVGYDVPLDVGWEIPAGSDPELEALALSTTGAILEGVRDVRELRRRAEVAAEALTRRFEEIPDDEFPLSLMMLADQLVNNMVVLGPAMPAPPPVSL